MQRAIVHYYRYNRNPAIYNDGLVEDDGHCLRTYTVIPHSFAAHLSEGWIKNGLLPSGTLVHSLRKYHFYGEYFSILQLFDPENNIIGYYCDITTPLEKNDDGEYELRDLILDLWIFPDGRTQELDWDEFQQAERRDVIPQKLARIARRTLARLVAETQAGRFPGEYISNKE